VPQTSQVNAGPRHTLLKAARSKGAVRREAGVRDADSTVDTRDKTVARRADPRVAASEPERAFPRSVINSAPAPRAAMAPGHVMFLQRTAGKESPDRCWRLARERVRSVTHSAWQWRGPNPHFRLAKLPLALSTPLDVRRFAQRKPRGREGGSDRVGES
jgi:Tfp pilus assembly protein FimV